jgi:hypothetical protein
VSRRAATLTCVLACVAWQAVARGSEVAAAGPDHAPLAVASTAVSSTPAAERARKQARDVLAQSRFHPSAVPRPLRSVRQRIGKTLSTLGKPFEDAFEWVASWLPGGSSLLWALLAAGVLAGAAALATRAAARRRQPGGPAEDERGGRERLTAAQLLRQAELAERGGDLDTALRLRFRAGLLDLDSRELVDLRPALTNHELLREVPSPTLVDLVEGFESVAYGGRPAADVDLRDARDGWPRVPDEARAP